MMAALQITILMLVFGASLAAAQVNQLETPRLTERDQRKEFNLFGEDNAFEFTFSSVSGGSRVDNAAVLQLQMDKAANVFLSTLPGPGSAQFATVLKPCGILLPHAHQRATEFYTVLQGVMSAGIAQENGGLQNITMGIAPGEVFIVPDGLLHYNHNNRCSVNVFLQSFNSADPGALNVINALAALGASGADGAAAIKASGAQRVAASPQGAFALDQACLKRCGFPATGAPGNGLATLNPVFKPLFGL